MIKYKSSDLTSMLPIIHFKEIYFSKNEETIKIWTITFNLIKVQWPAVDFIHNMSILYKNLDGAKLPNTNIKSLPFCINAAKHI